ncbi:MAG TPA: 50S ribosomal protein L15 [Candidatus Kapabacteria bacterium]|nr:50S ribosomal protein L15 [Candidatus Kapabacteria bacterium]
MDILSNLHPAKGATKKRKRIGRGQGSGHGGTATRGNKGAQARAGYESKRGFEGGQMPLVRRVPKFGFTQHDRVEYQCVNVNRLDELAAKGKISGEVTPALLFEIGAVAKRDIRVKILGEGELKSKLKVSAHKFTKSAQDKIVAAGGEAVTL